MRKIALWWNLFGEKYVNYFQVFVQVYPLLPFSEACYVFFFSKEKFFKGIYEKIFLNLEDKKCSILLQSHYDVNNSTVRI